MNSRVHFVACMRIVTVLLFGIMRFKLINIYGGPLSRRVFRSKLLLQAVDLPKKDEQEINILHNCKLYLII